MLEANKINTLLVANRGEIACRIVQSAQKMGLKTLALASDVDIHARHVQLADKTIHLPGAHSQDTYLNIAAIITAAKQAGADAVHPGYGFLSENADFARACEEAGLIFVGPKPETIALMADKARAKSLMQDAGVPVIPGISDASLTSQSLQDKAFSLGFPLMIKAIAGGGGRGMRRVDDVSSLSEAIVTAQREAQAHFGQGEVMLERLITPARHIEVQVLADGQGNVWALGERDCSVQRRHQKVIEVSPAHISDALRAQLEQAAIKAALACDYRGAGTLEFLVDEGENFYFLEMNTRLQVEHPITEARFDLDLVAWQLDIAMGVPLAQSAPTPSSIVAIEARLYSEDPAQHYLPQTGTLFDFRLPGPELARVDHGLNRQMPITGYYDPLLAKVICTGTSLSQASKKLELALSHTHVLGVGSNKAQLIAILQTAAFNNGDCHTLWPLPTTGEREEKHTSLLAAALWLASSPSIAPMANTRLRFKQQQQEHTLELALRRQEQGLEVKHQQESLTLLEVKPPLCRFEINNLIQHAYFVISQQCIYLADSHGSQCFEFLQPSLEQSQSQLDGKEVRALMDGQVIKVHATEGQEVAPGDLLITMETMKMEHPLKAQTGGMVSAVHAHSGQQVQNNQLLVTISESSCQ